MVNIAIAIIAGAMIVEIPIGGRLMGSEAIFALCVLLIPFSVSIEKNKELNKFYLLLSLWFVGAVVSDIYNSTPIDDLIRGWSKIIFIGVNVAAIRLLVGNNINRLVFLILMFLLADTIRLTVGQKGGDLLDDPTNAAWRYGYGAPFTAMVFLLAERLSAIKALRRLAGLLPVGAAAINLLMGARGLFGVSTLAALATFLVQGRRRPMSRIALMAILVGLLAASSGLFTIYSYAAEQGWLGVEARQKYEMQASSELSLLQAGRKESLASLDAIADSPIIGHGSWARDMRYVVLLLMRLEEAGVKVDWEAERSDLIPAHSIILGAWVEAGVLGGIFWLWVAVLTVRALMSALDRPPPFLGFIIFIGLSMLWDIAFSPLGAERRIFMAAWIYLMILVVERSRNISEKRM